MVLKCLNIGGRKLNTPATIRVANDISTEIREKAP